MDITSLGKEPITHDQPTGSDVRYETEFEQLQAEMDKISIPSASGGIDWKKVSDLSAAILAEKSKDLLVACYLAVSQIHIRQIEGLTDGLNVLYDFIHIYWENFFPPKKRMRGRLGAIEWWIEKTEAALKAFKPDPVAVETIDNIKNLLSQIDNLLQEYMPESPSLRPVQRIIEQIPSLAPQKTDPTPSVSISETPQSGQLKAAVEEKSEDDSKVTSSNSNIAVINTEQDAHKILSMGMQKVRQAAAFLLEYNPADPLAYRCRRLAAWMQISELPPASDGCTHIPPPAPQVLQTLTDLKNNGQWNALIINAEQRLSQFIFWLDINRWVAEALMQLGAEYKSAHDTVCRETSSLLNRIPGLMELSFSDETPFADIETREWLGKIRFNNGTEAGNERLYKNSDEPQNSEDRITLIQSQAHALAIKKKWLEAVGLFQTELKSCVSQKEALMLRMALCRILINLKRADMTVPHLDLILNDIEVHGLESWDPLLALEGLKLVWAGYVNQADADLKKNASSILIRIARLDPVEALKIG